MMDNRLKPWFYIGSISVFCLLLIPLSSASPLELSFSAHKVSSEEWLAEGVEFHFQPSGDVLQFQASISDFTHQSLSGALRGIELKCPDMRLETQIYRCPEGSISIAESPYGPQTGNLRIDYTDQRNFTLKIVGLTLADGSLGFDLRMHAGVWTLRFQTDNTALESLRSQIPAGFLPREWGISGVASMQADLSGTYEKVDKIKLTVGVNRLHYADQEGLQVAEDGELRVAMDVKQSKEHWSGSIDVDLLQGQFYSDPHYLEIKQFPLQMKLQGRWSPVAKKLRLRQARLNLPPALQAEGQAVIDLGRLGVDSAVVRLHTDRLDALYETLLQPMLIGTMVDELDVVGALKAELEVKQGEVDRFHASMERVSVDDRRDVFSLSGLNGVLAWSASGKAEPSRITVDDGRLYRIAHGPLSIHLQAENREISLLKPAEIPLLGGKIRIEHLDTQGLLSDAPAWSTSAEVSNLSLEELAAAFDWPAMSGELNGKLPAMHYRDHTLKLDGALRVDVFGGHIRVDQLMIKQPLGRVPELFASAELHDLDLDKITQTFSFGHIEGGLEGWVKDLHLLNWEPVAFQARFHSPKNDGLPHRISQRAVDNLTSLGNGVGGGLSSTFLGIFKEFRYNRIEMRAKLEGSLAELDGIDHPDGGYYLVKGAGLPRIDVIARNRRVAWKTLLERLKNIRVEGMEVR